MGLKDFQNGDLLNAQNLNDGYAEAYKLLGLNTIRQIKNRSVEFSNAQIDGWGEAYIDNSGRNNSVTNPGIFSADTTAFYEFQTINRSDEEGASDIISVGEKYSTKFTNEASSDTLHNPDNLSSTSNVFDEDTSTALNDSINGDGPLTRRIGKTFSSKHINYVYFKASATGREDGVGGTNAVVKLQTYDGSSWNDEKSYSVSGSQVNTSVSATEAFILDKTVQGVRIYASSTGNDSPQDVNFSELAYSSSENSGIVKHSLPTGTFPSNISSAFGVPFIENWEDGADIEYKLTNSSGDDSGWLPAYSPQVSEFTAFTAEPDTLSVRLVPKSSSPTVDTPSIKGFWVRAN